MSRTVRMLVVLAALLLGPAVAATPAAQAASAPPGMFNISDWAWPSDATLDREAGAGLRSWRVPLDFGANGRVKGTLQFGGADTLVEDFARRGITPLFVLAGCPAWACPSGGPPKSGEAHTAWLEFAAAAVDRYGPGGSFWAARPALPYHPVTAWQVFNEVNGSTQWPSPNAAEYAAFLASTAQAIRGADPSAQVVLSGLAEKMTIWMRDYLPALYAQPGFASSFDVMAIHGYTTNAADVSKILDVARGIMVANGDGAKPMWVTEMSWATGGPAHPFVVSEATQASNLRSSWDTLLACAPRWRLQRVYWFGWQDRTGSPDYWGYHNGLTRLDGSAKPALLAADEFTGSALLPFGRASSCTLAGGVGDRTAPQTTIASGPGARVAEARPVFGLEASEAGVRFECRLDAGAWGACTPDGAGRWKPAAALAEGAHSFAVRAVDAEGNADPEPPSRAFVVDLTPPETEMVGSVGARVELALSAGEPVLRFECKVDGGAWGACASPFVVTLGAGAHSVAVRAVDLAGLADPTPVSRSFSVAAAPAPGPTPVADPIPAPAPDAAPADPAPAVVVIAPAPVAVAPSPSTDPAPAAVTRDVVKKATKKKAKKKKKAKAKKKTKAKAGAKKTASRQASRSRKARTSSTVSASAAVLSSR